MFFVDPQAYAKKSALKGGLDMTVSLRKEMQEMQEWITQAEEEYLERDFQYKTPEELHKAVEELKVCFFKLKMASFRKLNGVVSDVSFYSITS